MKNLLATREQRGMSKYRLAILIGCSFGQVTSWERCESSPTLANAKKLAVALGTTIDELVGEMVAEPTIPKPAA